MLKVLWKTEEVLSSDNCFETLIVCQQILAFFFLQVMNFGFHFGKLHFPLFYTGYNCIATTDI